MAKDGPRTATWTSSSPRISPLLLGNELEVHRRAIRRAAGRLRVARRARAIGAAAVSSSRESECKCGMARGNGRDTYEAELVRHVCVDGHQYPLLAAAQAAQVKQPGHDPSEAMHVPVQPAVQSACVSKHDAVLVHHTESLPLAHCGRKGRRE